jgi:hypothetical protein
MRTGRMKKHRHSNEFKIKLIKLASHLDMLSPAKKAKIVIDFCADSW